MSIRTNTRILEVLSRDIFDTNMDLDYIIRMSTMMRTEEVKNGPIMTAEK
jgi:hypothetical protein